MATADSHFRQETEVFRRFVEAVALGVVAGSIRRGGNYDIDCKYADGTTGAFELVEIVGGDWAAKLGSWERVGQALRIELAAGTASATRLVRSRFEECDISVTPRDGVGTREFSKIMPAFLEWLSVQPTDGEWGIDLPPELSGAIVRVRSTRISGLPGPLIHSSGASWLEIAPSDGLRRKFAKSYPKDAKVQLLAYFLRQPPPPYGPEEFLELAAEEFAQSTFDRMWLFNAANSELLGVYPPDGK
jgi:hypothetical protein